MPEQRQAFQRELDDIDAKVIELLDLVTADLARATPALANGNNEVVKVLAEHGLVIDLSWPEIEKLVKTAILLACRLRASGASADETAAAIEQDARARWNTWANPDWIGYAARAFHQASTPAARAEYQGGGSRRLP